MEYLFRKGLISRHRGSRIWSWIESTACTLTTHWSIAYKKTSTKIKREHTHCLVPAPGCCCHGWPNPITKNEMSTSTFAISIAECSHLHVGWPSLLHRNQVLQTLRRTYRIDQSFLPYSCCHHNFHQGHAKIDSRSLGNSYHAERTCRSRSFDPVYVLKEKRKIYDQIRCELFGTFFGQSIAGKLDLKWDSSTCWDRFIHSLDSLLCLNGTNKKQTKYHIPDFTSSGLAK